MEGTRLVRHWNRRRDAHAVALDHRVGNERRITTSVTATVVRTADARLALLHRDNAFHARFALRYCGITEVDVPCHAVS